MHLEIKPQGKGGKKAGGRLGSDFCGVWAGDGAGARRAEAGDHSAQRWLCSLSAQLSAKQAAACADEELANEG